MVQQLMQVRLADMTSTASAPDFAVGSCLHFLLESGWVSAEQRLAVVFLGYGRACTETKLLAAIQSTGVKISNALFMDVKVTSVMLHNVQHWLQQSPGCSCYVTCSVTCREDEVLAHIHEQASRGIITLMIGIHARLSFETKHDAQSHARFLGKCQEAADEGFLQPRICELSTL
jgi:hypothetical protein